MQRQQRQAAILSLVAARQLGTQAEVAKALRESGFPVVQTTVSRDIAELGLVKVRSEQGRLVYAAAGASDRTALHQVGAALRRFALTVEAAGPLVVVTTHSGSASALAQALDESALPVIAGTIAGDNTIFVAPRDGTAATTLAHELSDYLMAGAA